MAGMERAEQIDPPTIGKSRTGIGGLDVVTQGGFPQGRPTLLCDSAGSGKTTLAAHFADATCAAGQRCIYFATEEPPRWMIRNMRSIGIDLQSGRTSSSCDSAPNDRAFLGSKPIWRPCTAM